MLHRLFCLGVQDKCGNFLVARAHCASQPSETEAPKGEQQERDKREKNLREINSNCIL